VDMVYSYRHNQQHYEKWPALYHSIMSAKANYVDIGRIFVVADLLGIVSEEKGHFPDVNVIHYPGVDTQNNIFAVAEDIHARVALACNSSAVSDDFVWMCDDFYFVNKVKDSDFGVVYCDGVLCGRDAKIPFNQLLIKTRDTGAKVNLCCHHPIVINKKLFLECYEKHGGGVQLESSYIWYTMGLVPRKVKGYGDDNYSVFFDGSPKCITDDTKFVSHIEEIVPPFLKKIIADSWCGK